MPLFSPLDLKVALPQGSLPCKKICSIDSWGEESVYIGSSDGVLYLYYFEKIKGVGQKYSYQAMLKKEQHLKHGKKAVELIETMPSLGKLFLLCDGTLEVLNLYSLEILPLQNTKWKSGVLRFCSQKKTQEFKICVHHKRKLYFYEYTGQFQLFQTLTAMDNIISFEWCDRAVCVSHKKGYSLLDPRTGASQVLLPFDSTLPKFAPKLALVGNNLLISRGLLGIITDFQGEATRENIGWAAPPLQLAFKFPFVLSLHAECIEVHSLHNMKLIQSIPFPKKFNFNLLASGKAAGFSLIAERGSTKSSNGNQPSVFILNFPSVDRITQEMIKWHNFDDAISFLDILGRGELGGSPATATQYSERIAGIHAEAGMMLLDKLQWQDAFDHFVHSTIDPRIILGYFPDLLPAGSPFSRNKTLRMLVQQKFVQKAEEEATAAAMADSTIVEDPDDGTVDIDLNTFVLMNTESLKPTQTTPERVIGRARHALMIYLEQTRSKYLDSCIVCDVNTAILLLYIEFEPEKITPFCKNHLDNLHLAQVEESLISHSRFLALGHFYTYQNFNRKALKIWTKLARGVYQEKDGARGTDKDGLEETINLLISLDDEELLFDFSRLVFAIDQQRGIEIFISDCRKIPLNPALVLNFLYQFGDFMCETYLEYLVLSFGNNEEKYHTKLASLYIETIVTLLQSQGDEGCELLACGKGLVGETEKKLLDFLTTSKYYNAQALLKLITGTILYEVELILLERLGDYSRLLRILVYQLKDDSRAELFCQKNAESFGGEGPYITLFRIYLEEYYCEGSPYAEKKILPPRVIHSFLTHHRFLDVAKVLDILPPELPLEQLFEFLSKSFQRQIHLHQDISICKNLYRAVVTNYKCHLVHRTSANTFITKDRICPVCSKNIQDKVFYLYPNSIVVCFRCVTNPYICPVTGRNFKEKPATAREVSNYQKYIDYGRYILE